MTRQAVATIIIAALWGAAGLLLLLVLRCDDGFVSSTFTAGMPLSVSIDLLPTFLREDYAHAAQPYEAHPVSMGIP